MTFIYLLLALTTTPWRAASALAISTRAVRSASTWARACANSAVKKVIRSWAAVALALREAISTLWSESFWASWALNTVVISAVVWSMADLTSSALSAKALDNCVSRSLTSLVVVVIKPRSFKSSANTVSPFSLTRKRNSAACSRCLMTNCSSKLSSSDCLNSISWVSCVEAIAIFCKSCAALTTASAAVFRALVERSTIVNVFFNFVRSWSYFRHI